MQRPQRTRVLVVEDDDALREVLQDELRARENEVEGVASISDALDTIARQEFEVAILDLMLPDGSGIDVLRHIAKETLPIEVIILTGFATVSSAIEAMKLGAYDYLTKPTKMEELEVLTVKAAEKARLRRENASLRTQIERLRPIEGIITEDAGMKELLEMVDRVAVSDIPVLIQGETGTGKELIARAIHRRGPRAPHPFVAINCSAVSESLLESELFGHERGAFTGATERKPGLIEVADRGVLFLDEVGDIAASTQVKLLRAIETGEFMRVGGVRTVRSDVRVVSASHKDLLRAVRDGNYREDLYHRLNGVTLRIPALRDRSGDVTLLATHFLSRFSQGSKQFTARCLEVLNTYSWPGNVRELRMVIQRASILAKGESVEARDLLLDFLGPRARGTFRGLTLAEVEYEHIRAVLDEQRGHKGKAAKALGIDPKTLYNKLKAMSLETGDDLDADSE